MSDFHILIPKLGESIQEATITKLFVKQGDTVVEDDILFEIATDKVDSEIPSPVAGTIKEIRCSENDLIPVGQIVIVIALENDEIKVPEAEIIPVKSEIIVKEEVKISTSPVTTDKPSESAAKKEVINSGRFYSPLVNSIAAKEGVTLNELESIKGSGLGGRVQKNDIIKFVEQRTEVASKPSSQVEQPNLSHDTAVTSPAKPKVSVSVGAEDTILKMDRIRKLIATHM
jgi:2-oxoglutarate dehydrogenase E2 component (dihydrolipoamide succinyltransferase)